MRNIMFSTTRSWNPGDEFILFGLKRIFKNVLGDFNPIIYNRHPDIHVFSKIKGFSILPVNNEIYKDTAAFLRIGTADNSIKYSTDCSFIDLAVCAGTPEWLTPRCINFYEHVIRNQIPFMALGIGSWPPAPDYAQPVLEKALLVTSRQQNITPPSNLSIPYASLPCPALLCSETEKTITACTTIGLIFALNLSQTVNAQNIDDKTFDYMCHLYRKIITKYNGKYKFKIICHYIDELPVAHRLFDAQTTNILYSYSSEDYLKLYEQCDLVISPRVHGCGIASSLAIPNICIAHDNRAETTAGFLSERISIDTTEEEVYSIINKIIINIATLNQKLQNHKKTLFYQYSELVQKHLNFDRVAYPPVNHFYKKLTVKKRVKILADFFCLLKKINGL